MLQAAPVTGLDSLQRSMSGDKAIDSASAMPPPTANGTKWDKQVPPGLAA